jgi:hypothetical protein
LHSWKYKKIKNEQRKAKRRGKQRAVRSGLYINQTKEIKTVGYKDSEFFKRMKKLIWRNVFRSRI